MPSPFPGMDPYLENPAWWPTCHHHMIGAASHFLQPKLRRLGYYVSVGERLCVTDSGRGMYPDLTVVERPLPTDAISNDMDAAERDHPVLLKTFDAEYREPYLEIFDAGGHRLVTGIEFLSPANKSPGQGRDSYLQKQKEVLEAGASLVEVDLLRTGRYTLAAPESGLDALPNHEYLICVSRAGRRGEYEAYPIGLPDRLPRIGVPLKAGDPDVVLDLQAAVNAAYQEGAFEDRIDYSRPPPGRMSRDDLAWCEQMVRKTQS